MSISAGDWMPASDPEVQPPYEAPEVALSNWPDDVKRAWRTFRRVSPGDLVRWGDRTKPLEITARDVTDQGYVHLDVEGPRGGTYTIKESYSDESGAPQFYANDSAALDLHEIDAPDTDGDQPFTEAMYENLVSNLTRASVNARVDQNYDTFEGAARSVVRQWVEDVDYHRWQGWPYNWSDDTPTYIFRMVREHAGELPEVGDDTTSTTPKRQAQEILEREVRERGQSLAHQQMVSTQEDYGALVEELASDAVERDSVKVNIDARDAARSVVEDTIDAYSEPVYKSIIQFGHSEPMDFEMYSIEADEDITREMAFDILDTDVWAAARRIHQDEGTHDPTVRGLAFYEYDELAEALTEKTLREHNINDNRLLYTTAKEVVQEFADSVEAHDWDYNFGGVGNDATAWGAGDVEDIFTSITMHSEKEPQIFNPYARDKERKMAAQVLTEDVHERASSAMDAMEMAETPPVPADEYLRDELGMDMDFNDIRDDAGISVQQFIREAIEGLDAEDAERELAGWTFVDELVEEANATVPYVSGPWVLVDYGVVRKHDTIRKLAYFNRDDGSVLRIDGHTTQPPSDGEFGYTDDFSVSHIQWSADGTNEPNFLTRDVNLDYAYEFMRDYIGADETDVRVIETNAGEHFIQEAINRDDLDATSFASGIAPSFSIPGPDITVPDALTYGTESFKRLGGWLRENSSLVDTVTTAAVALFVAEIPYLMYRVAPGLSVEPDFHKNYGVGIKATYEFGQQEDLDHYDPSNADQQPYTGRIQSNVRITPGAFKFIADGVSPSWLYTAGPDATVLKTLQEEVTRPIREEADGLWYGPRAVFLAAHLPPDADGRPHGDVGDYEIEALEPLDVGQSRSGSELRSLLTRAARHGYTADNGYRWEGDSNVQSLFDGEVGDDAAALNPWELLEVAWSIERDHVLGPLDDRLVGYPDEVEEGLESGGPVLSHQGFLQLWGEFPNTPEQGVLEQVWEFYKARADDQDEAFTLVDAYDRFRMGLVYDTVSEDTKFTMAATLQDAAANDNLESVFQKPKQREYWWNVSDQYLEAADVFNTDAGVSRVPSWLVFPASNRPGDRVVHTYFDPGVEGGSYLRTSAVGDDTIVTGAHDDEYRGDRSPYKLATQRDVYNSLLADVRNDINAHVAGDRGAGIVTSPEEYDPANPVPEEKRKWLDADASDRVGRIEQGSVRWDDLDGTDLSVMGLFLRGIDIETAAQAADHWNLTDRFSARADDILPANFEPARPDIPSFDDWLDRRRGRNAVGSAGEKAKAKARYLREVAENYSGHVSVIEELGVDEDVPDEIEEMREVQSHYDDSDPYNLSAFYGDEFGESFDNVAHKFNDQRPYDESEMMGSFPELDGGDVAGEGPMPDEGDVEANRTAEEPDSADE